MRPISPHLSVYKPQLTSVLSILHRITGVYLFLGVILISWLSVGLAYFPSSLENLAAYKNSNIFATISCKAILITWIFALFYHSFNGIRHLFWDIGRGFNLSQAYFSGKIVIIFSIMFTAAFCILDATKTSDKNSEESTKVSYE